MRILALDCATKTGWAICDNGKIVESGVQEFALQRGESPGMRFLRFTRWLNELQLAVSVVAYEQAHHRGGAATEVCVGMTTRAQELAAARGAQTLPVHTGRLKKWATGNGGASKQDMIDQALSHLIMQAGAVPNVCPKIIDDNHADAILLALYAWAEVGVSV